MNTAGSYIGWTLPNSVTGAVTVIEACLGLDTSMNLTEGLQFICVIYGLWKRVFTLRQRGLFLGSYIVQYASPVIYNKVLSLTVMLSDISSRIFMNLSRSGSWETLLIYYGTSLLVSNRFSHGIVTRILLWHNLVVYYLNYFAHFSCDETIFAEFSVVLCIVSFIWLLWIFYIALYCMQKYRLLHPHQCLLQLQLQVCLLCYILLLILYLSVPYHFRLSTSAVVTYVIVVSALWPREEQCHRISAVTRLCITSRLPLSYRLLSIWWLRNATPVINLFGTRCSYGPLILNDISSHTNSSFDDIFTFLMCRCTDLSWSLSKLFCTFLACRSHY